MIRIVAFSWVVLLFGMSLQAQDPLDLWLTDYQQGALFYLLEDYDNSAQTFSEPLDKARAFYANQNFSAARNVLKGLNSDISLFYLANSYAHEGRLEKSIAIYRQLLELNSGFSAAEFNLNYVVRLHSLDQKEYDDAGGTGGKLKADEIVFDKKAEDAVGEINIEQIKLQTASDEVLRKMWMRRVQTTPGDFLSLKFQYQLQNYSQATEPMLNESINK